MIKPSLIDGKVNPLDYKDEWKNADDLTYEIKDEEKLYVYYCARDNTDPKNPQYSDVYNVEIKINQNSTSLEFATGPDFSVIKGGNGKNWVDVSYGDFSKWSDGDDTITLLTETDVNKISVVPSDAGITVFYIEQLSTIENAISEEKLPSDYNANPENYPDFDLDKKYGDTISAKQAEYQIAISDNTSDTYKKFNSNSMGLMLGTMDKDKIFTPFSDGIYVVWYYIRPNNSAMYQPAAFNHSAVFVLRGPEGK